MVDPYYYLAAHVRNATQMFVPKIAGEMTATNDIPLNFDIYPQKPGFLLGFPGSKPFI